MKKLLPLLLLIPTLAWGQSTQIQVINPSGAKQSVKGTIDGAAYFTELYPREYQYTDPVTLLNAVTVTVGGANGSGFSNRSPVTPFASSINGFKWCTVIVTSGANVRWRVLFLGSEDGTNWEFLTNGNTVNSRADGDTIQRTGLGNTPAGGISFPVTASNGFPIIHRYLGVVAAADSGTASATTVVTVKMRGRQY